MSLLDLILKKKDLQLSGGVLTRITELKVHLCFLLEASCR